jgi:glycerol-3-phosphate dehydrogenase
MHSNAGFVEPRELCQFMPEKTRYAPVARGSIRDLRVQGEDSRNHIYAYYMRRNKASGKEFWRDGMKYEGSLKQHIIKQVAVRIDRNTGITGRLLHRNPC